MAGGFDPEIFNSGSGQASGLGYDPDVFGSPSAPAPDSTVEAAPVRRGRTGGQTTADAGNALGTGFWRGAVRLAGLPVDTAANLLDLGKAGVGSAYLAATGKVPPSWLDVGDRSRVVGSGDYLLDKVRHSGGGWLVDPASPEYEGGMLQAAGGGASAGLFPGTALEVANRTAQGMLSAGAGKLTHDLTGSTPLAITASMLPGGTQQYVEAGAKRLVRGGEQGRKDMRQRVADLERAGITNPTLGLASGNRVIGGVENLLQSTPGAMSVMGRARDTALNDMRAAVETAADRASPLRGAGVAGQSIQADLKKTLPERFRAGQERVYGRLDELIPSGTRVNVANTDAALTKLTDTIPGAEQTSQSFINGRIRDIKQGLDVDTGRVASGPSTTLTTPTYGVVKEAGRDLMNNPVYRGPQVRSVNVQSPTYAPAQPSRVDGMGLPIPRSQAVNGLTSTSVPVYGNVPMRVDAMGNTVPVGPVTGSHTVTVPPRRSAGAYAGLDVDAPFVPEMPYQAVKGLRTNVGTELSNASLVPDVPTAQWKQLYGALSRDMEGAAQQAGLQAEAAWNRANAYTRAGMGRLERVAPLANTKSPEDAFLALARSTREHVSTLQAVKKSVTPETRGQIASTIIDRLGRASPGQQNELGDAFSPDRFLSNWSAMTPAARRELFSGFPGSDRVRADVEATAKAAAMMRDTSRMWANPSGTAANAAARAAMFGLPLSYLVDPLAPVVAGAGLGVTNVTARALAGPKAGKAVREWAVAPTNRTRIAAPGLLGGLEGAGGLLSPADQLRERQQGLLIE